MSKVVQPEGNYYDKYGSTNPIVQRLMQGFFASLDRTLDKIRIPNGSSILEAGCGEGNLTARLCERYLKAGNRISGFDISDKVIAEAKEKCPGAEIYVHDIMEPISGKYDLVVCCEVLEHMDHPEQMVQNLMSVTDRLIISVPSEPIWRILNMVRGKYWKNLGNTPGHVNHYSKRSLGKLLSDCGLSCICWEKPLPWLMVYCEKKQ